MGVGENFQKAVSLALPPESPNSFCWLWRADRPAEFLNSEKLGSWHITQEVMSVLASKLGTADAVRQGEERAGFYHPFCEKRAVLHRIPPLENKTFASGCSVSMFLDSFSLCEKKQ